MTTETTARYEDAVADGSDDPFLFLPYDVAIAALACGCTLRPGAFWMCPTHAAAPALLAACEAALGHLVNYPYVSRPDDQLRAAIAQATGPEVQS